MRLMTTLWGLSILFLLDFMIVVLSVVYLEVHWCIPLVFIVSVIVLMVLADAITKKMPLDK